MIFICAPPPSVITACFTLVGGGGGFSNYCVHNFVGASLFIFCWNFSLEWSKSTQPARGSDRDPATAQNADYTHTNSRSTSLKK